MGRVGVMMGADTTERLMAWEDPQEPPLTTQRVKNDREKAHRVWGRTQGDTELTGKVPTDVDDRSQLP